jgi:hypothetical protein
MSWNNKEAIETTCTIQQWKLTSAEGLPLHQSALSVVFNLKDFGVDNCWMIFYCTLEFPNFKLNYCAYGLMANKVEMELQIKQSQPNVS